MQLVHAACGEEIPDRRGVGDIILPKQKHAWNTGVVVKKRLRQGSKGVISETVLRQVKAVQPNMHSNLLCGLFWNPNSILNQNTKTKQNRFWGPRWLSDVVILDRDGST